MVKMGVVSLVIGLVVAVLVLPVLVNVLVPTHTLNVWVNDSVVFTDEGAVAHGQTSNYPINGELTQCANNTDVLATTVCNVSTASNGTIQAVDSVVGAVAYNISYSWEDASYLQTATQRNISKVVFVMVVLGLFIMSATMLMNKGGD